MMAPDLLSLAREAIAGEAIEHASAEKIDAGFGAYALFLNIADPVRFARRSLGEAWLSGWFVYVGSARGSGGLRARLGRHFRRGKPVRWHVDELTNAAAEIVALAIPGGSECDIVARLERSQAFAPALIGFGSSDCRSCRAHLLKALPLSAGQAPISGP